MPRSDRAQSIMTLLEARKRADEIVLHIDRALTALKDEPNGVMLDGIETHLSFAHTKVSLVKQAIGRTFPRIDRLRVCP